MYGDALMCASVTGQTSDSEGMREQIGYKAYFAYGKKL